MENSTVLPTAEMPAFNALELLEQKSVAAFFQPIVSVKKKSIVGLEALGRGVLADNQQLIEPQDLYKQVGAHEPKLALDRLFRDKGLEGFQQIHAKVPDLLLFLNIEASILTNNVVGSGNILKKVQSLGLESNLIVIEISQSENIDPEAVKNFVELQREKGFLVGLEDVNNSRARLDQVFHLNPDVIKVEAAMVQGIAKDSFKREGFKTIVSLARSLGSLVIANGIENEEDAMSALEMGADMLQGSYLSKPQKSENSSTLGLKARIVFLASRFQRIMTERMNRDKERKNRCQAIVEAFFSSLTEQSVEEYENMFNGFFVKYPQLECLYLLNQDGVQVTETVCNLKKISERKKFLFQPAPKGTDHALKEYYYILAYNELERYVTDPYISLASGNLCITVSRILRDPVEQKPYILCADIDVSMV